ncbi:hypothetical protein SPHINGO8AM_130218 [Sphingomonas sp. 8AM]|nr:hypothetical protein SPHINGO8AM_130218 [Sphingomonas sp. 8AM]
MRRTERAKGGDVMKKQSIELAGRASRRSFLTAVGAGVTGVGVTLLAGCNDDIVGAEAVPEPTPTATPTPPVAYEATDSDLTNFTLQIHYLLAGFLQSALTGSGLPANLTGGAGTPGQVSGGRAVLFTTPALTAAVREVTTATIADRTAATNTRQRGDGATGDQHRRWTGRPISEDRATLHGGGADNVFRPLRVGSRFPAGLGRVVRHRDQFGCPAGTAVRDRSPRHDGGVGGRCGSWQRRAAQRAVRHGLAGCIVQHLHRALALRARGGDEQGSRPVRWSR